MYESTMDILYNLWPHVSDGGWIIVDDYNAVPECKDAITEFLSRNHLETRIEDIDGTAVYFKKSRGHAYGIDKKWYLHFNDSRNYNDIALESP